MRINSVTIRKDEIVIRFEQPLSQAGWQEFKKEVETVYLEIIEQWRPAEAKREEMIEEVKKHCFLEKKGDEAIVSTDRREYYWRYLLAVHDHLKSEVQTFSKVHHAQRLSRWEIIKRKILGGDPTRWVEKGITIEQLIEKVQLLQLEYGENACIEKILSVNLGIPFDSFTNFTGYIKRKKDPRELIYAVKHDLEQGADFEAFIDALLENSKEAQLARSKLGVDSLNWLREKL